MADISVHDMIVEDHNKIRSLYDQFKLPGATQEQKQQLVYAMIREISMHSSSEEEAVYPVIKDSLGEAARDHLLSGHQKEKELLYELDHMKADGAGFDVKVDSALQLLLQHMREEEDIYLKQLAAVPGVDMVKMGKGFRSAKSHAVTRPHPSAPDKPPMNVAANMATAPLDAAADMLRFQGAPPS